MEGLPILPLVIFMGGITPVSGSRNSDGGSYIVLVGFCFGSIGAMIIPNFSGSVECF